MASLEELRNERLKKLERLRQEGYKPYPSQTEIGLSLKGVVEGFDHLIEIGRDITTGGRAVALRRQGGLIFVDLISSGYRLQTLLKEDDLGGLFELFAETIDLGDFIQVTGKLITTKRGEKTIEAASWKILAKSLRPLPDQWSGLKDTEERLRKRYLDILLNEEVRDLVVKRQRFWQAIRDFLTAKGFLEVETPILEVTAGGADAKPFKTHHNALGLEVSLRISAGELWQKKLLVAGFDKVFEIGRVFRNEGMDAEHLQDYTAMEFYWAYADYEQGMVLVEELYRHIAQEVFGTLCFKIGEFELDFGRPWERYDFRETVQKMTGIDVLQANLPEIEAKLKELRVEYDHAGFNLTRAIDNLWKHCRKQLAGPGFLVGLPIVVAPLAKRHEYHPELSQTFQPIIAGSELGKGYSELNDPLDQATRFDEQMKLRAAGDEEAQIKDDDFIEALEYGMPPACGFGLSERLFAFLMNKTAREAQIFPLMRPKEK
ncbi:MAG: lysine--tRNA ligase [Candidatus Vogelbacteria bacterium CG10_big_fil_rev_8_21_14_0_10_49_38]|uniref:Lysine--tRNA ligase n=1 Tax=Candidatus Vogelbacteria bacterium CG10_big_fil_rev_8_21_14_0_10_49_38 TaxID=1975043 RepID=A0A2H0RHH9_9BACT|nr:MAG: lysine--tRNA ligase [bacterium CG10_49_38]PIR45989.1 MAG: lysine--tRNA ligase [Candidatus Vogelbacteria bacterium CG10_big_fil_rev_8_21_14_0_10_49_38]